MTGAIQGHKAGCAKPVPPTVKAQGLQNREACDRITILPAAFETVQNHG
jgi:hypothetical protein